ncbi:DDE-type integrase/transposase/recombinase [Steroidobacter flavus]|uniref:DDE-type integrase/transposase/recombinase n=1 Tax=Steroidobacter flavus TaxID=1842136 RepID=A0ABV8SY01_9GAMM
MPCSDQTVHVAFSLHTCDREVVSWCAGTGAISGEMIRDLMIQSVEQRFKSTATAHPVQWLSDNGSCYRAHETIEFATRLGLVPCFTPPRSPQSNGMAEAFVKTFKRDCVFRPMSAADSAACRPPIPRDAGRGFRGMSAPS